MSRGLDGRVRPHRGTDGDVVPVRILERKLNGSSARIHMWLFFQPADESPRPLQSYVKVVDPKEQEEAVARLGHLAGQACALASGHFCNTHQDPYAVREQRCRPYYRYLLMIFCKERSLSGEMFTCVLYFFCLP
jgi:hypothetical protein